MIPIRCHTGLASRVTAIVNALCRTNGIDFVWRVNAHCPARHEDVFPHGVPGVTFLSDGPPALMTRFEGGRTCDFYEPHPLAAEIYSRVVASLAGSPPLYRQHLAVCARFFRRRVQLAPAHLAAAVATEATRLGCDEVFLLADSHRSELAAYLAAVGVRSILPQCPELAHDMDRNAPDVLKFCSDWRHLLAAGSIVTHAQDTALLHPAMAVGTPLVQVWQ